MAKQKVKPKKKHVFQDPTIEEIVEVEVEFIRPKRGKVKQKVKMKKLKAVTAGESKPIILAKDDVETLDTDDGLSIYDVPEEIEE